MNVSGLGQICEVRRKQKSSVLACVCVCVWPHCEVSLKPI